MSWGRAGGVERALACSFLSLPPETGGPLGIQPPSLGLGFLTRGARAAGPLASPPSQGKSPGQGPQRWSCFLGKEALGLNTARRAGSVGTDALGW